MTNKLNNEAQRIWLGIPAETRKMLLGNVWCGKCGTVVTICDFNMNLEGSSLVLNGFCNVCGYSVARVIEDCRKSPGTAGNETTASKSIKRQGKKESLRNYIFNVWVVERGGVEDYEKKVLRRIQIVGSMSLYSLARVITKAFGFYFDHCFGFYDNFERYGDSKMSYELFVDVGEAPETPVCKGVKKTKIRQVFKEPKVCFGIYCA